MFKTLRLEKSLSVLVFVTALALFGQDWLLQQSHVLVLNKHTPVRFYSDKVAGGNSEAQFLAKTPNNFTWRCNLLEGNAYPYCGLEIILGESVSRGLDLSRYKQVRLWFDYHGRNKSVRIFLRNFDRRYSLVSDEITTKYNQVEFETNSPQGYYEFSFDDFFVANWWLREHSIAPGLSHPQFDNLVSFEIQSGSSHLLGPHQFTLRRVELVGQRIDTADWYLAIILAWGGLVLIFLLYRVVKLSGEVRERKRREAELIEVNALLGSRSRELESLAVTDSLTGAFNRNGIKEAVRQGLWEWRHGRKPLSIVMMDVDHFKSINDTFGHGVGDEVLTSITALVKSNIRTTDMLARWGGEEFVLVCRNTHRHYAASTAEKLRDLIEKQHFSEVGTVTASFGVASLGDGATIESLFKAADAPLYRAKEAGRNRVEVVAE
ncbi:GGDEF domain-containing protein [Gilvimarinus chinensis]|uniref:GGDEF domain-containing protein n=1 Tax=Gilvimarinus chinensis TaxID=396005 RepID=UPI000363C36C|nr:GGDEF domain-containing protein [Gilvimarinus chinensis]